MARAGAERARTGGEDKRRRILRAAVKVFAERGYHGCRIADIATEAGVAYGLVYHYFDNKEALLTSIFEESWDLFNTVIGSVADQDLPIDEKLRQIVSVALDAYRAHPATVKVMILEIARSPFFLQRHRLSSFDKPFAGTARVLARAQAQGEVRADVDPTHGAYLILGTVEMILTGFVLGTIDVQDDAAFEAAKQDTIRMVTAAVMPVTGG